MFPYTFFHSGHQLQKVLNYNFKFAAEETWLNNGKKCLASKLITMLMSENKMREQKKVLQLRNYAATENDDWSINKCDKLPSKLLVWKELGLAVLLLAHRFPLCVQKKWWTRQQAERENFVVYWFYRKRKKINLNERKWFSNDAVWKNWKDFTNFARLSWIVHWNRKNQSESITLKLFIIVE